VQCTYPLGEVNLNTSIVKRKSQDVWKATKSLSRKRTQPGAKFVDDGSGDTVVQNKRLHPEPAESFVTHTSVAASEVTGLVTTASDSTHSSVLHTENKSASNVVSTSVPSTFQLTSHTVASDLPGTVATSSSLAPKVTETSRSNKHSIKHLKFSSVPVTLVDSVVSTMGHDRRQTATAATQASRVQTPDTVAAPHSILTDGIFLFWPNEDSLCWLDVAMALIVNCDTLRGIPTQLDKNSCLNQLLMSFDNAQVNFRQSRKLYRCHYLCGQGKAVTLETSVGQVTVKTGGGHGPLSASVLGRAESAVITDVDLDDISSIVSATDPHSASLEKVSREAKRLEVKAKQLMVQARDDVFRWLQPRMHCERGECNSALIALSDILAVDAAVRPYFTVHYTYSLSCTCCGHTESGT